MTQQRTTPKPVRRVTLYRLRTVALAVAAAETVYLLARYGAGTDLALADGTTVGPAAVAVAAAVAGLAGWALLAVLERVTSRARLIWTVVAAAVFAVSLLGPLGGADAGAVLALSVLHSAVAGVLITGLPCRCR
ncbi:hypothetical protein I4J89_31345 [Actinoplanes sp. NEAU-A11]|uniref:Uncharacterized protein n=1 Tax=Actinoplanes aureus TaxID=2792083 RepID=A0A931CDG3_9ACTN|nr:hypothetical protein [Actinoplanes aureus]